MRFGSKFMGTQISTAKAAAAIVGLLIALALSRDVAAQPAELRVLSSAAPRSILNEMSPVFERMAGRKIVVRTSMLYCSAAITAVGTASRGVDGSITEEMANNFATFFDTHPNISHVFFNGGKAETVFRHHVLPMSSNDRHTFHRLPSTSPAHATMTLEAKMKAWSVVREVLDHRERLEGIKKP